MIRARIYITALCLVLLTQGLGWPKLPLSSIVGLVLGVAGMVFVEWFVEFRVIGKHVERIDKLEKTTAEVFNALQNRMSTVESKANIFLIGKGKVPEPKK